MESGITDHCLDVTRITGWVDNLESSRNTKEGYRFTARLMRCILIFILGLGASYLMVLSRRLFPADIMRATLLQVVLYGLFGLVASATILTTIIYGLRVFSLLLQAYEAGAKVLNGNDHRNDF
jgi:hypothetical protein